MILKSSFVPDAPAGQQVFKAHEASMISFQCTICTINAASGAFTLTCLEEKETGLLDIATMHLSAVNRGRTKDTYHVCLAVMHCLVTTNTSHALKLTIGSKNFVTKKLVHISDKMDDVPPEPAKAYELLTQDLIRLKRMAHFAKSFSWEAGRCGVEIAGAYRVLSMQPAMTD